MNTRYIIQSFINASRGFVYVWRHERHFRFHLFVGLVVLLFALYIRVSALECAGLVLIILLVLVLEIINSAVERLVDVVTPRLRDQIRIVKDMLASMVLLASLGAVAVGLLILLPHII